ncbi:MAG TPA: DUF6114 domain-containing protein [Ktedonobacteraceae bacterium]
MHTPPTVRQTQRLNLARQAARLRRTRLTATPAVGAEADQDGATRVTVRNRWLAGILPLATRRHQSRPDALADWRNWSRFRLWRHTRPFWGSLWMIVAALILLVFPLSLLQFAFLVNTLWAGLLIGGLLLVMGLVQLFFPLYAIITGSIGIVLALVSFVTNTFGGLALGMLLGIIGCALSIAWRPVPRSRLISMSDGV